MFGLGKKKKDEAPPPSPERIPLDRVMDLSSKGYSDPEIIRTLRQEGFAPQEVDKALKEALKTTISPRRFQEPPMPQFNVQRPQPQPYPGREQDLEQRSPTPRPQMQQQDYQHSPKQKPPQEFEGGTYPENVRPEDQLALPDVPGLRPGDAPQQMQRQQMQRRPPMQRPMQSQRRGGSERLEELAESIVDERINVFETEMESVQNRVSGFEARLAKIEKSPEKSKEAQALKAKMEILEKKLTEMHTKLDVVDKVVKDSLTPMMETMRAVADTVRDLKDRH